MLKSSRARFISAYEFGHPPMVSNFSREVYKTPEPLIAGAVQKTKLNNGVTVISQDKKGQMSSLGFFAEAGAKYDPATSPGLSYAMRWAGISSNFEDALHQTDRALRAVGASYGHTEVNKRYIGWIAEVPRQSWKTPVEKFANCFAVPRFAESDIERWRDTWDNQLEEMRWTNPREYVAQMIETTAFYKEPLGNPRHVQPQDNDNCSSKALIDQYAKYMAPQRFTISAVNIDHHELIAHYSSLPFQMSSSAPHFKEALIEPSKIGDETSQYYPLRQDFKMECRAKVMGTIPDNTEDGVVALGWLTYGADKSAKEYATALVCREILNGLSQETLRHDRNLAHHGARTFYNPYSSAGLMGFTVRTYADKIQGDVEGAFNMFAQAASNKVSKDDIARASQRATVSYFNDKLENQRDYTSTLATSAYDAETIMKAISGVSADDVNAAFSSMKKHKPVGFSTGAIAELPTIRSMWHDLKL